MSFKSKYGPYAIITGASDGLGKQYAYQLAHRGVSVLITARREEELNQIADDIKKKFNVDAIPVGADLSKQDDVQKIISSASDLEVNLLINNAGFATTGEFVESDINRELEMLYVSTRAPLILSRHFGNLMKQRKRGGIIMLSSIVAFTPIPLWSQYTAVKAFDLNFGLSLYGELKPYNVDVLTVCPGATITGFQKAAGVKPIMSMTAEKVVKISLDALGNKPVVVTGIKNKISTFLLRFMTAGMKIKSGSIAMNMMKK